MPRSDLLTIGDVLEFWNRARATAEACDRSVHTVRETMEALIAMIAIRDHEESEKKAAIVRGEHAPE